MAQTVLVVEDERKLRDFIRTYLERAGFTVLSTGSGAEALTLAGSASPDLVVLDLGLPDVSGETVARELRGAGRSARILMLTAKSAEEDRIRGLELGADDYLTKPFSPPRAALGWVVASMVIRCSYRLALAPLTGWASCLQPSPPGVRSPRSRCGDSMEPFPAVRPFPAGHTAAPEAPQSASSVTEPVLSTHTRLPATVIPASPLKW